MLTVFRPDADLLSGPSPGGSSPVQKSKLQGEQIQQLKAELRAAQDGCLSEKRRAGEYLAQLQTRGEYILLLQSQLNDLQQDNTALRQQLAAPGASSNGDHGDGEVSVVPRSEHEAVVQQLTEQIQQLRLELANSTAALAPPTTPRAEAAAAGAGSGSGSGSVSTDDLATHIDTARATASAADASSPAAAAAAALSAHAQEVASQQQVLQQQFDDLTVFVKQLEGQAAQREALMGGLLAQVGGSCVSGEVVRAGGCVPVARH